MKSLGAAILLLCLNLIVITAGNEGTNNEEQESFNKQICQPDIYTVLREISVQIAEQQVELRHNKEQLQAAEKKAEAVETRLRASESQVEGLRRDREVSRVSFSAALGDGRYGPSGVATPLVFRIVFTNVGNAYNVNTGVFTAPVRGVYHFVLFVFGDANPSTRTGASIQRNGKQIVLAYDFQVTGYYVKPANGVSLLLEVGDVVQVKLYPKAWVRDTNNHHTTFSGHLLFTM